MRGQIKYFTGAGAGAAVALALTALACGPSGDGTTNNQPPPAPLQVNVTLDAGTRYQTMQGFGGAVAFYVNWFSNHPAKADIASAVFSDLGIQLLRIGNWYQNSGPTALGDTVHVVQAAHDALGRTDRPLLEMSGWSPPASLKSNNNTNNGGTLATGSDGQYRYADYGQWWATSVSTYAAQGVVPDFLSIQNEPDFVSANWQTNLLAPMEDSTHASYGKALDAVVAALQAQGGTLPQIWGPEVSGVAGSRMQSYTAAMTATQLDELQGLAHHLYSGGTANQPGSFNGVMATLSTAATGMGKPIFMTEYGPTAPDMFDTAWLVNNAVTVEGASGYIYWPLTWAPPAAGSLPGGLVTTENPGNAANWTTPNGWQINDIYYAIRHFSKWTDVGWQRVSTTADVAVVKTSAFVSPDSTQATIVLLNVDTAEHDVTLATGAFPFTTSHVYRTSGTTERTTDIGPLGADSVVILPGRGIATVTLAP
jgi:glucuronoarabinoxylan endo-1,4-beta-xylanase